MSRLGKWLWFSGTALLVIVMLFGCAQLFWNGPQQDGWYIKLNINNPTSAKAITVTEYDVTGLAIEVYDPHGELIEEISWQAEEGQESYLIPVSEQGQHEIVVTHISGDNGEVVEAKESAFFNIQAMVITVIDIIPGCIGTINVEPGDETSLEDGTVTVEITGADALDGEDFISAVLAAGANPYYDDAIGLNSTVIVSGTAQAVALDPDNLPTPFTFTGGTTYDVYGLIDLDGSGNPTVGDYISQELGAEVDGDMVFVFVYPTDFAEITSIPAEGTLTIGLTAAGVVEGKRTMFAVFDAGADPYTDPMLATAEFNVASGSGSSTAAELLPPYGDWLGTGGNSYDVYLWVDIDGDSATVQYPESGVDMRLKTFPYTVDIDGNVTLTYSGTDLETVP